MSSVNAEPPADDVDGFVLDETFIAQGRPEPSAEERVAKARRIARANDDLRTRGEIADGSGKPAFQRTARRRRVIAIAAAVAVGIVLLAIIAL